MRLLLKIRKLLVNRRLTAGGLGNLIETED
jgi:hypothetical protein